MIELKVTCDKCGESITYTPMIKGEFVFTDGDRGHYRDRTVLECVGDIEGWEKLSRYDVTITLCPDCKQKLTDLRDPEIRKLREVESELHRIKMKFLDGLTGNPLRP